MQQVFRLCEYRVRPRSDQCFQLLQIGIVCFSVAVDIAAISAAISAANAVCAVCSGSAFISKNTDSPPATSLFRILSMATPSYFLYSHKKCGLRSDSEVRTHEFYYYIINQIACQYEIAHLCLIFLYNCAFGNAARRLKPSHPKCVCNDEFSCLFCPESSRFAQMHRISRTKNPAVSLQQGSLSNFRIAGNQPL